MTFTFFSLLANHLWQSTLFAVAAGLLAMAFRKNHAWTRYWIWWIASLKFLIPFSLLVTLGSYFGWRSSATPVEPYVSAVVIKQVTQPFTSDVVLARLPVATGVSTTSVDSTLSIMLTSIWLCGGVLMASRWWRHWKRAKAAISTVYPEAVIPTQGRETEALRRLEARIGKSRTLPIVSSKTAMEPSVKEVPVYNLVLVRMGKVKLSDDQTPLPPPSATPAPFDPAAPPRGAFGIGVSPAEGKVQLWAGAIPISSLINFIQGGVGRMVIDKVEPKGLYDIPQVELDVGPFEVAPGAVTVWPEIMSQLGFRMDPATGPAEVLGIDQADKPSEN